MGRNPSDSMVIITCTSTRTCCSALCYHAEQLYGDTFPRSPVRSPCVTAYSDNLQTSCWPDVTVSSTSFSRYLRSNRQRACNGSSLWLASLSSKWRHILPTQKNINS